MKAATLEIELITNVARLQREMADMRRAVGGSMDSVVESARRADRALDSMGGNITRAAGTSRLARLHIQNLAFQFQDLGIQLVGAAQSAHPFRMAMTAVLQQGSQISGVMMQSGVGLRGMASEVGGMAARLASAHPILTAFIAVLSVAGIAAKRWKDELSDGAGLNNYVKSLGLTKDEMKKLTDVTVTWGDLAGGLGDVIMQNLGPLPSFFQGLMDGITSAFSNGWSSMGSMALNAAAVLNGAFVGAFFAVKAAWSVLPGVMADVATSAANYAIDGLNWLVSKSLTVINGYIATTNRILAKVGMDQIGSLSAPKIGKMANEYSGAAKSAGANIASAYGEGYALGAKATRIVVARASNSIRGVVNDVGAAAQARALNRLRGEADAIIAARNGGTGNGRGNGHAAGLSDEQKAYEAATKAANDYIQALKDEEAKIGKTSEQIKQMEINAKAAAAPTAELARLIRENGASLISMQRVQGDIDFIKNTVEPLEFETRLLNMNTDERRQATIARKLEAVAATRSVEAVERYRQVLQSEAGRQKTIEDAQQIADQLGRVQQAAEEAGSAMRAAFGDAGGAIADVLNVLSTWQQRQAGIDKQIKDGTLKGNEARMATLQNQVAGFGALAGAAKGFFGEHSKGYKAMEAAERGFAVVQLAMTAINLAAGAAKMFGMTGPGGFALVPAMMAVMAGVGYAVGGGGGGGGFDAPYQSAEQGQKTQGTGTVLGDFMAQSQSLTKALELTAENTNRQLEYSNAMVKSLRSIEANIGNLTAALGRQFQLSGFGFFSSQGIDELKLGKVSTASLVNSGVVFQAATLGKIMADGITGNAFETIKITMKKGSFAFDVYNPLAQDVKDQTTLVLTSIYQSIIDAAGQIGMSGLDQMLKDTEVALGKISLQGLSGSAVTDALNAVFGAAADTLVASVLPALTTFQKAGEGLFETLVRLGKEYRSVDVALQSIGRSFGATGADSIAMRTELVGLFKDLSDFIDQTNSYRDAFLTEAEQIAPVMAAVASEMARLGLAGTDTIDKFKAVVNSLDLTSDSGRSLYAALMAVAPAFAAVEKYQDDQQEKAKAALEKLYDTQRDELSATQSKFANFADTLREFRASLTDASSGQLTYNQALARLMSTGALAGAGDATALANLQSVSRDFLTVAKDRSSSFEQYQSAVSLVSRYVGDAIAISDAQANVAQQQLDAINQSVDLLSSIALTSEQVAGLLSGASVAVPSGTGGAATIVISPASSGDLASEVAALRTEMSAMRADLLATTVDIAFSGKKTASMLERWNGGSALKITNDGDDLLKVEVL